MKRILLLLALSFSAAFADHPPQWLKLPQAGEPRPPGVSAWVLESSEQVTQLSSSERVFHVRRAVMVLSDAGTKYASFAMFLPAGTTSPTSARAWAMSPDGKKCRAFGGNEFAIVSSSVSNIIWDQLKMVYFSADRYVQPGWVVAYEIEYSEQGTAFDLMWNPRESIPVRHASFRLMPAPGGVVRWERFTMDMPEPGPEEPGGGRTWALSDLSGLSIDMPPYVERDSMQLRADMLSSADATKSWADVVRLARAEIDPKAVVTPALGSLAREKAAKGSVWARILPICRFVQKEITYLEISIDSDSMAGYRPHPAAEVCQNRYGDCKDKAVLLCTMLRAVGVDAYPILVNSGLPLENRIGWPSAIFNHAIVAIPCVQPPPEGSTVVRAGGTSFLLFDPTDEDVPFGLLPAADSGGLGLILADAVSLPVLIPKYEPLSPSTVTHTLTTLAEDGSATVDIDEARTGLAASWAITDDQTTPFRKRTNTLEKRIQSQIPLISDLSWSSASDPEVNAWSSKAHFSALYVGKRTSGGMYVATNLMSVVPYVGPWDDPAEGWVNVTPSLVERRFELKAPAGWEPTELPSDWSAKTAAGEGTLTFSSRGDRVSGEFRLKIEGGVMGRKAYLEYRNLLQAAVAAEHRPVVLRRAKAALPTPPPQP